MCQREFARVQQHAVMRRPAIKSIAYDRACEALRVAKVDPKLMGLSGFGLQGQFRPSAAAAHQFPMRPGRAAVDEVDDLSWPVERVAVKGQLNPPLVAGGYIADHRRILFLDASGSEVRLQPAQGSCVQGEHENPRCGSVEAMSGAQEISFRPQQLHPRLDTINALQRASGCRAQSSGFVHHENVLVFMKDLNRRPRFFLPAKHMTENRSTFFRTRRIGVARDAWGGVRAGAPPEFGQARWTNSAESSFLQQFGRAAFARPGGDCARGKKISDRKKFAAEVHQAVRRVHGSLQFPRTLAALLAQGGTFLQKAAPTFFE